MFQDLLPNALHGRLAQLIDEGIKLPDSSSDELRVDLLKVLVVCDSTGCVNAACR